MEAVLVSSVDDNNWQPIDLSRTQLQNHGLRLIKERKLPRARLEWNKVAPGTSF